MSEPLPSPTRPEALTAGWLTGALRSGGHLDGARS